MKFNLEGPFWQFVTLCVRYFALNLLFLVTLVPVVTIGPARAALYSTVFAYIDNEDIPLCREYLKRFKKEFVRGIGASLIFVVLAALIIFGIVFWNALDTDLAYLTLPLLIIAAAVVFLTFECYFPLQARYDNTFRATLLNAVRIPWAAFRQILAIIAIDVAAAALFSFTGFFRVLFVLLGCAWLAYAKALVYLRIFARVSGDPTQTRDDQPDYSLPTASIQ
ncbi:YesL family protein [Bifidobacterium eulemuris]|uniref:YesL family protein n=1 Tax=Bifidobacterium eulemuris TaxID=1765219 RepID=A0A261GDB9_9BIFI|nr:YesL family protein [Bifidobacterium eulemuris]OZG69449.1 hypothetical protein BEUL_0190 [Bifidobacterium eulemuris]QOL32187.1 YesL family protein [Bifidobacterium eulemuris]